MTANTAGRMIVERSGRVVAHTVELAQNPWSRLRGLLGRRTMAPGAGLLIRPCRAIHTWFMRFPIDVVFLNRTGRVLRVVARVRPFRAAGARGAEAVLELAAGMAREADVRVGDRLCLELAAPAVAPAESGASARRRPDTPS